MTMAVMSETEALAQLRAHMVGQRAGVTTVTDVTYEYPVNEDMEEYLCVNLVLADPPSKEDLWPSDDIYDLIRRGREEVRRLRIAPPFFVTFKSQPEEWDEDEEEWDEYVPPEVG